MDLNLHHGTRPCFPDLKIDPYSLPFLLQKILEWANMNSLCGFFPWSAAQMKVLANYASTLDVDPDLAVRVYAKLGAVEGRCGGFHFSVETVYGALQELGELFRVPKLHQLKHNYTLTPRQLVVGFITFLVELLDAHSSSSVLFHQSPIGKVLVSLLKFLVAILGDAPFEATEHEQVQSILTEFEQVANEAVTLIHSLIFVPHHGAIDEASKTLLGHINLLFSSIVKFLHSLPSSISFPKRNDTRDSLFIVINLIRDLIDRVTREGNDDTTTDDNKDVQDQEDIEKPWPWGDVNDDTTMDDSEDVQDQEDIEKPWDLNKIVDRGVLKDLEDLYDVEYDEYVEDFRDLRMLYVRLRLLLPFLKGVNVPQHFETEFNQLLLQIRDKGCVAGYLIKRDLPVWYRTIRIIQVTSSLVQIGSQLHEMKTVSDVGTLKVVEDCLEQPSLKMEDYGHNDIKVKLVDVERNILDQLVRGGKQRQIITIFGMAGIGKTTLAKGLYNQESISCRFDRRAWITVSQTYKTENLLIEILNCLGGHSRKTKTMNIKDDGNLVTKIYQILKGRRYLIVMDDLWDLSSWQDLRTCFPDDGNGSRILFTSRYKDLDPSAGTIKIELPLLSDDQCWDLLQEKAFHGEVCPPHLEVIGRKLQRSAADYLLQQLL